MVGWVGRKARHEFKGMAMVIAVVVVAMGGHVGDVWPVVGCAGLCRKLTESTIPPQRERDGLSVC